ncbi:hypothetical protein BJ166DRAFT_611455 [Pestalotiopsis sp. NC0098]|nr:hypothetical protein BJ166DRAFT_611455 [Pestalotiopsis sp. NC0098]
MLLQFLVFILALLPPSIHALPAEGELPTTLEKVLLPRNPQDPAPTTTAPDAPPTGDPIPHPPVSSFTTSCDDAFCSEGQRYCYYWGGMTSYELGKGPVPGETHTILGACTRVTTTLPGSVVTQTLLGPPGAPTPAPVTVTNTIPPVVTVVETLVMREDTDSPETSQLF